DRAVEAIRPRLHVEIGELLVAIEVAAIEGERDLERRQRALPLAQLVETDLAERRPQPQPLGVFPVAVAAGLRPDPLERLAIEAGQLLPLLPLVVQLLERLGRALQ